MIDKWKLMEALHAQRAGHQIAFKIWAKSADKVGDKKLLSLKSTLAFALMLSDLATAALHGNLELTDIGDITVAPVPTGYFSAFRVIRREAAIATLQQLAARYGLADATEIAWRGLKPDEWHRASGPNFGPFKAHFDEVENWKKVMEELASSYTKPAP